MSIPSVYAGRFAYHFFHINNLEGIVRHGLLSCNEQSRLSIKHFSIAEQSIQNRRSTMEVPCRPGSVVHDYVPFYFCKRSSMLLAVINKKNVDQQWIAHLAVPIELIDKRTDVVFTSASANTITPPEFYSDATHLDKLQWSLIDSQKWSFSEIDKQSRMAELLVHRRVDFKEAAFLVVWNDHFKKEVRRIITDAGGIPPEITTDSHFHFTKYPSAPNESLVTGPQVTRWRFEAARKDVVKNIGMAKSPTYKTLHALRTALRERESIGAIQPLSELVDLESDNAMHKEDVANHTFSVVDNLLESPEFKQLCDADKLLSEIGAYFHDVGKGPRERWKDNGYKQKVDLDHPVSGVEITAEFLKAQIASMRPRSARVILMLVCYHDLIGDILGKGRNRQQLLDAVTNERDVNMLFALSRADIHAVYAGWWDEEKASNLREWVLKELQHKAKTDPEDETDD